MSLSKALLKTELQKFIDKLSPDFVYMPYTVEDMRAKFKAAIDIYLADIRVVTPSTVTPKDTQIDVSESGDAFKDELIFDIEAETLVFHTEMASAYDAMIQAITMTPSGDYLGDGISAIQSIDPLLTPILDEFGQPETPASGSENVQADMFALCQQFNTGEEACEAIADTIHSNFTAILGTNCTYSGSIDPGPLGFG